MSAKDAVFASWIQGKAVLAVADGDEWTVVTFTDGTRWEFARHPEIGFLMVEANTN